MKPSLKKKSKIRLTAVQRTDRVTAKDSFRRRFKRSMRQCMKKKFSVEACFGVVWEETLEKVGLSEKAEKELYKELIVWTRQWIP